MPSNSSFRMLSETLHFIYCLKILQERTDAQSDDFKQINTFTASRAVLEIVLRKLKHHIAVLRDNQHRWETQQSK